MCISMTIENNNEVFTQLQYMKPCFYATQYTAEDKIKYPLLPDLLNTYKYIKDSPFKRNYLFETSGGNKFVHFAKNKNLNADIYSDFMRVEMKSCLQVASWVSGSSANLVSKCDPIHKVVCL